MKQSNNSGLVDVAIQMYGKPLMTAVAISSLLNKSGKWINKVYLIEERKQPHNASSKFIANHFKDKVIRYRPWLYHGALPARKKELFMFQWYRNTVRYQYAFENTRQKYLYTIHNDMLFHEDILGEYLQQIQSGDYAGAGPVGMCWNCPASYSGHCSSDTYWDYRPAAEELSHITENYHAPRKEIYDFFRNGRELWPLPECRINEWSALIDVEKTAPFQYPYDKEIMFGNMDLDTAVRWFHKMSNQGLQFKNAPLGKYATHVWTGQEGEANSGNDTLNKWDLYLRAEQLSYQKLIEDYGFKEEELKENKLW